MKLKYYSGAQVTNIIEKLPSKEYLEMLNAFAKETSADVVEVVRCKKCKHSLWDELGECYWCKGKERTADFFCADGERRDDE